MDVADVSSEYAVWARFGPGQFAEGQLYNLIAHSGAVVSVVFLYHIRLAYALQLMS